MNLKLAIAAAAATAILMLGTTVWYLGGHVRDARSERDAAFDQRDAAFKAIDELAVERARAELRYELVQSTRESILSAPNSEDGEVAPALWLGLRAADQIGGIE